MTILSPEMCAAVGLTAGSTAHDLVARIEQNGPDVLDGLLTNEVSRAAAIASLNDLPNYSLEVIHQVGTIRQQFIKLAVDGIELPVMVGFIGLGDVVNPVTELENLLFWAAVDPRGELHRDWRDEEGTRVINWRASMRGKALLAVPSGLEIASVRRLVAALFSLQHAELPVSSVGATALCNATNVSLQGDTKGFSPTHARLIFEAISETSPKWRCLSFYRILENAYLNNIKNILNSKFDFGAKRALEEAVKSVSSEVQQLIVLTTSLGLQDEFLAFNVEVEALLTAQNKFIEALDASASDDRDLYGHRELWRKAVLRFYKLRCSIAHGGTSSVIYEQFSDANTAALALLPSIEEIAFKSLKLKVN